jgi:hypothetical protein
MMMRRGFYFLSQELLSTFVMIFAHKNWGKGCFCFEKNTVKREAHKT